MNVSRKLRSTQLSRVGQLCRFLIQDSKGQLMAVARREAIDTTHRVLVATIWAIPASTPHISFDLQGLAFMASWMVCTAWLEGVGGTPVWPVCFFPLPECLPSWRLLTNLQR